MAVLDRKELRRAADTICKGRLVAIPTETVYGLAADATSDDAVARIFEAKGRPRFNPLIVHVAGAEMAARYVSFSPIADKLAAEFWPGPLTLVLPRRRDSGLSLLVSAGLDSVAIRAPKSEIAQALIKSAGRPLAAPSANLSGAVSPTRAEHVAASLGDKVDKILDGGPCPVGIESTIVKTDGDDVILLRPGGLSREAIESCIGKKLSDPPDGATPQAPGMLQSHYAPNAILRLNAAAPETDEAYLAFGAVEISAPHCLNLSKTGNLRTAAANLFAHLHTLDQWCEDHRLIGIAVAPVPKDGLGEAINDRLKRAAAPRAKARSSKN